MLDNTPCSAMAVARQAEEERIERECQQREKALDRKISLETLNELQSQNALLKKQIEESKIELEKSRKYNKTMLIIAVVSMAVAVASLIATIVIAIVK